MSNETKRDVFKVAMNHAAKSGWVDYSEMMSRYTAALPDDLPVIPKDVSEWLTWCKSCHHSLKDALDGETRVSEDDFALAWLLGVWRVEETGEIVKLDAEVRDE